MVSARASAGSTATMDTATAARNTRRWQGFVMSDSPWERLGTGRSSQVATPTACREFPDNPGTADARIDPMSSPPASRATLTPEARMAESRDEPSDEELV